MPALVKSSIVATRFIRTLRGGSLPVLAEANDGLLYVLKFANNPQGPNLPFNEVVGTKLYQAAGLPVPKWKPVLVSDEFLDHALGHWRQTNEEVERPASGLCFGSHYLGGRGIDLMEILPSNSFMRIQNRMDFWLAWLVDVCARHSDNRQAIFKKQADGRLYAIFIDHGNMFCGPRGNQQPRSHASAYLDKRIYERISMQSRTHLAQILRNLNVDRIWREVKALPEEWKSASAIRGLAICLDTVTKPQEVENVLNTISDSSCLEDRRRNAKVQCELRSLAFNPCLEVREQEKSILLSPGHYNLSTRRTTLF